MTKNDKNLIYQAQKLPCIDWPKIDQMISDADTLEAKEKLKIIQLRKYHHEESKYETT